MRPAPQPYDGQLESAPTSVLIAAARGSTRTALWMLLEQEPGLVPIAAAPDLAAAVRLLRTSKPDVALISSGLLRRPGAPDMPTLKAAAPHVAFIVIGMGDHPGLVARARAAGAADYVRLDQASERLAQAVRDATSADAVEHHGHARARDRSRRSVA